MTGENDKKIDIILKENSTDNSIPCQKAIDIARQLCLFPDILGLAMQSSDIKVTDCQMGLFGCGSAGKTVTPTETVPEELEGLIYEYLDGNYMLECQAAWEIASELKIKKTDVASACEKMNIKISRCQLGVSL